MMLLPLLLALVAAALKSKSVLLGATAVILAAICYAEPGILMGAAQSSAFARWFVLLCPAFACFVLLKKSD